MAALRRITVCREGWYYLLVLGLVFCGAMLREVNLLLILAGLLLGPLLFNLRAVVVTLRNLEVRRKMPQAVCAGDLLVANVSVTNARRRIGSWAVVVEDEVQPEPARAHEKPLRPSVLFPYVPAGQTRKGVYRGRLVRRGRYRVGPLRISTRFPFGLFCRTIVVGQGETLTVLPRLGRLSRGWAARRHEAFAGTHRRERRHGTEGDFYGLRPWHSGDSRRWIHWRSSARSGELLVRQFEQPRNRDVAVLVDLWQPPRPAPQDRDHVELAVSFAATVLSDLCRKGGSTLHLGAGSPQSRDKTGTGSEPRRESATHTTDGEVPVPVLSQLLSGPASLALLQEMMERLAVVEAESTDRLAESLARALGEIEPGTEIVLVSTRPIDLSDRTRFAALWADPARRSLIRRIRCVDVSSKELSKFFRAE
jgi:uncharacterized protein (DUF58 family)